ncbi:MAG TPA: N-acetylmuramoyl-L-alanine amidase [Candidatus Alistipes intestinipullorum]|nr:N-acetylmuramoyl-L-alanine amidase [Candidatus Alistipes intestinipullorum]
MRTRLLLLSLLAVVIIWTNGASAQNIAHGVQVVVIDAGHGGKYPGAHYGGVYEKELTLKVALKLGKFIEEGMPGVKVVYTRKSDKALGDDLASDLQARADIANKAGGDLFISIHANAAPRATGVKGTETLIMGETTKEQRYNENALYESNREDLIDMSDERTAAIVRAYIQNLQFTYGEYSEAIARCIQNSYVKSGRNSRGVKPQLLRVLYATDMPSALTEIGFMTNAQELAYMKSDKGQTEIARSIYQAVRDYSAFVMKARTAEEKPVSDTPANAGKPAAADTAAQPAATSGNTSGKQAAAPAASSSKKPTGKTSGKTDGKPAGTTDGKASEKPASKPAAAKEAKASKSKTFYSIQVMASAKPVSLKSSQFGTYRGKVKQYTSGGRFPYKYCVGEYADREAAQRNLREVRRHFSGAFVVCCRDGRIVDM